MANNNLVVPMKVQVLYVNNSNTKEYANTAWNMDSLRILDPTGSQVEPNPFTKIGGDTGRRFYKDGAYLHWIVPDAFTKGTVDENGEMNFLDLCNAFNVYRSIRSVDGKILDDPDTQKKISLDNIKKDHLLSPIENGDPAYCANYEQCKNDLGCYDDLMDILKDADGNLKGKLATFTGKLCYTIVGYYSEVKNDPLNKYATANEDALGFLNERDLILTDYAGGAHADRLIWFGECYIDIDDGKLQCECTIPEGEISFAIGNSATDAFSAYIASRMATNDKQKANFEKNLHKLFDELESQKPYENYDFLIDDETHVRGFLATSRGNKAELAIDDVVEEDKKCLNELNLHLEALNRLSAEYENIKEDAYIYWQNAACKSYVKEPSQDEKNKYNAIAEKYNQVHQKYVTDITEKSNHVCELLRKLGDKCEKVGEDRFWSPKEPCLLIAGEGLHNKFLQGFDGTETDDKKNNFNKCVITPMDLTNADFDMLWAFENDIANIEYDFSWKEPWNPLFVEWLVRYSHEPKEVFLEDWELEGCDFSYVGPKSGKKDGSITLYSGRSVANPFMTETASSILDNMANRLSEKKTEIEKKRDKLKESDYNAITKNYYEEYQNEIEFLDRMIKNSQTLKNSFKTLDILIQPLSGFNEMMIGKKETFIKDCGKSKVDEKFDIIMQKIYQDKTNYRKLNGDAFYLTRQGSAELAKIWIIDSFGRYVEFSDNYIDLICSEEYKGSTKQNGFMLKPRLVVPARIKVNQALDKPVFGWIVPNFLDNSIYGYDEAGRAVGYFYVYGGEIQFRRMPINDILANGKENAELEEWISSFLNNEKSSFLLNLLDYLDNATCNSPEIEDVTDNSTMIFDKKIFALVKIRMDYELMGLEPQPVDKDNKNGLRDENTRGIFSQLRLRLGGSGYSNDGLLLFYNGADNGEKIDYGSYKKSKCWTEDDPQKQDSIENEILFDPYGGGVYCTLLMEPTQEAVFISGLLPSIKFRIPVDYVAERVKNIQFCSEIGSFLSITDEINMPLPVADNLKWTFLQPYWKEQEGKKPEFHMEPKQVRNILQNSERQLGKYMVVEGWLCVENTKA